jgi:hypothetical protein
MPEVPEAICGDGEADRSNLAPVAGNRGDLPTLLSEEARSLFLLAFSTCCFPNGTVRYFLWVTQ